LLLVLLLLVLVFTGKRYIIKISISLYF
jgi:hypothetical protein